MTAIGGYAFSGCSNLTSVDLSNVRTIGDKAFAGCRSLDEETREKIAQINSNAL